MSTPELDDLTSVRGDGEVATKKKKKKKKFIKSTVTVHDRTQIEAVFDYFLLSADLEDSASLRYRVEAYFFFPPQLGLTDQTYPKDRFYADVRPLIRFREPRLGFKRLRGLKPGDTPLSALKSSAAMLAKGATVDEHAASDEVRVFACSLIGNFLKNIDRWRGRFAKLETTPAPTDELLATHFSKMTRLLDKMQDTLVDFRDVARDIWCLPEGIATTLKTELKLIDEYCYYRFRDGIAFLLIVANDYRGSDGVPEIAAFEARIKELLDLHDRHAQLAGYILIRTDSPESVKEHYLRRRGELKRRVWSVLFLDLRTVPLFAFRQQLGPMIAAGLAASWAVVVQVLLVRKAMFSERTIDLLGLSGMFFLLIAVLAYIVKDRIKEIGRSYFRKGLFRKLPDHSERIHYEPRRGQPRPVGNLTEIAKFETLTTLPAKVAAIRAAHELFETPVMEDDDSVLHYTKEVSLNRDIKILDRYPLRAVHDILRFNIDSFLPRLGEPVRAINVVDDQMDVHAVTFPKVYYVDLALRYSQISDTPEASEDAIDYFRLVLDKTGLLRVERLT